MKTIRIKNLTMVNFRMFKNLTIELNDDITTFIGMNGSGKSTIMTAVSYLFFDKDQFGRKDFEIKPLTKTGEAEHNLDSEVSSVIYVNDEKITLKKVYHEIWRKPKGEPMPVFSGHETLYYYCGVPVTMREYTSKMEAICPESLFVLLTNPLHFPNMNWIDQRKLLFDIAGTISDSEIASKNPAWVALINSLNAHKTMDEYKREIASEKRKIKDDLDRIPARVDEVLRALPPSDDFAQIEKDIAEKGKAIQSIDQEISDLSAGAEQDNQGYMKRQQAIHRKQQDLQAAEYEVQKAASRAYLELFSTELDKKGNLKNLQGALERLDYSLKGLQQEEQRYINEREDLKAEYYKINALKEVHFIDEEFTCPTCKRKFEDDDVEARKEKLMAQYNSDKAKKLADNQKEGLKKTELIKLTQERILSTTNSINETSKAIETLTAEIESGKEALVKAEKERDNWKALIPGDINCIRITKEIETMKEALGSEPKKVNIIGQTLQKEAIQKEINELAGRLSKRDQIAKANTRVEELKGEQKRLAQELADKESIEYNIQQFTRAKIEAVEEKINGMFSLVSFKLFDQQVNGSEAETCSIMVNGVTYRNLNNAGRIQAGLDVIKTLSSHYGVSAPCILDNRESVTDIPEMDCQIVNLIVDPNYKVLTVI